MRREVWDDLDGFDPMYFAYHEDTDLSVRSWLSGRRVVYVPDAVADHHYEFGRSPLKMYLLERNRLVTVLTDFPGGLLRRVLPALVVVEPLLLAQAVLQGWGRQKVASMTWLVRNAPRLRARRRRVQAAVTTPDALAPHLVSRIEPPMVAAPPGMGLVNAALALYWRLAGPGRGR
jgi:GT2 family glycosyltransferase